MKIIRELRENRLSIIIGVLICVFVIGVVQLVNSLYKDKNKDRKNTVVDNKYKNESKTVISEGNVSTEKSNAYGELIEAFLKDCFDGKYTEAYDRLSSNCKKIYYNSVNEFVDKYCKTTFNGKSKYKFQSWVSGKKDIYQIKLFEDILATGKALEEVTIDYYTIEKENGLYKLNINNFIGIDKKNTSGSIDEFEVNVNNIEIYKDYYVVNFTAKNNSNKTVLMDGREDTNTVYIEDEYGTKFKAQLYENTLNDLKVQPGEQKKLRIKFNIIYREDLDLNKIIFKDIHKDDNIVKLEISL